MDKQEGTSLSSPRAAMALLSALAILAIVAIVFLVRENERMNNSRASHHVIADRIFMHRENEFTFLVPVAGTQELRQLHFSPREVKILRDVPADQSMHATYSVNGHGVVMELEIHLRSAADINGAGWDKGKFGHGTTTVVE